MKKKTMFLIVPVLLGLVALGWAMNQNSNEAPGPAGRTSIALPRLLDLGADTCIPCKLMAPILETLKATRIEGRKILVLGDMLELGQDEERFHKEAGREAASAGVDVLIGVGHLVRHSLEAAGRAGVVETHLTTDAGGAAKYLSGKLNSGDLVLVKGSRGIRLDRLVQRLVEKRQEAS